MTTPDTMATRQIQAGGTFMLGPRMWGRDLVMSPV
eukprot:CAMPEP_0196571248 /NCGR_PEP_ID=MMETSP1081-20130531/1434_1 /TAXON_ID=36882 /ORGANISM="Pyramimonas amylifera, Strain CCMP720" /LENGTH=34 /DNA_ID= /DNA_START= /DNA_END= /DNA_ORIENTATION=